MRQAALFTTDTTLLASVTDEHKSIYLSMKNQKLTLNNQIALIYHGLSLVKLNTELGLDT